MLTPKCLYLCLFFGLRSVSWYGFTHSHHTTVGNLCSPQPQAALSLDCLGRLTLLPSALSPGRPFFITPVLTVFPPPPPSPPTPQTSGYRSMAPESTLSLNMGTRTTAPAASLWLPSVLFDRVLPGLSLVDAFSLSWPSAVHTGVTFLPVLQPP